MEWVASLMPQARFCRRPAAGYGLAPPRKVGRRRYQIDHARGEARAIALFTAYRLRDLSRKVAASESLCAQPPRYLPDNTQSAYYSRRANPGQRPLRPHDHRHVSRQPLPRLLTSAECISRSPRLDIDTLHPHAPLTIALAPKAGILLRR